jgi:hypothetical protein
MTRPTLEASYSFTICLNVLKNYSPVFQILKTAVGTPSHSHTETRCICSLVPCSSNQITETEFLQIRPCAITALICISNILYVFNRLRPDELTVSADVGLGSGCYYYALVVLCV